jgi:hypothetical protein
MGPTALLPLQRRCAEDFLPLKILTASAGFEPANLGTYIVVVLVSHKLPLVDSRGDEKANQKASFYGICLTFQAVISLHYTFFFWLMYAWFYAYNISVIISCLHNQYL